MDVKAALSCNNRRLILSSCEYAEKKAIDTYDHVLKNHGNILNVDQQKVLTVQLALIHNDHNNLKDMHNKIFETI
jgi:hypothetical protein